MQQYENMDEIIQKITPRKIAKIFHDPLKMAKAVNLVYISDNQQGIIRQKQKKTFRYFFDGKEVKSKEVLERIKKLGKSMDMRIRKRPSSSYGHRL